MATKKAKSKTTKKKAAPVNKKTTTRVVSAKTIADENKTKKVEIKAQKVIATEENVFAHFFTYMLSGNAIRMIVLEMLGIFVIGLTYLITQGHPMYLAFSVIGVYMTLCHSTGGFFNPALSFGAWITRKISGAALILQLVAQSLGTMLVLIANNIFAASYGIVEKTELKTLTAGKEWYVFAAELIGLLLLGIFLSRILSNKKSNQTEKAFALGFGLFAALLVASTFAGYAGATSLLNPTFLMLFQINAEGDNYWVWILSTYVIAPLIGGMIGFLLGDSLVEKENKEVA